MKTRNNGEATGRDPAGRFSTGNPGRPKGARHRSTIAAMALLDGEAEALTRRAIDMALAGDATALRLCIERLVPPRKEVPVVFDLPEMTSARDAANAASALVASVASGVVTPAEGAQIMGLIDSYRRTLELTELEARMAALEARQ